MNWHLAIEKNHEALKRILAMLVAMVGMTGGDHQPGTGDSSTTLPRHLHRFVLRLLRPAEAATRRLIIVAARGLVVKLPKLRVPKPKPEPQSNTIFVLDRVNGSIVSVPVAVPAPTAVSSRSARGMPSLSLLDPMKRFGMRRRYAQPGAMPQIRVMGIDDSPIVPFFRRPERTPPTPPAPTPDDPLNAHGIHRRLDAIGRALEDLPAQAQRMARWQARRDARLAREREACEPEKPQVQTTPSTSRPSGSPPLPHCVRERTGAKAGELAPVLSLTRWGRGGEPEGRDGEGASWEELGVTPEALALCRRANLRGRPAQSSITAQTPKRRRFHRLSPMRPGRPPGWRKKPNHDVYEVLNEFHGLAVWARDGP